MPTSQETGSPVGRPKQHLGWLDVQSGHGNITQHRDRAMPWSKDFVRKRQNPELLGSASVHFQFKFNNSQTKGRVTFQNKQTITHRTDGNISNPSLARAIKDKSDQEYKSQKTKRPKNPSQNYQLTY